MKSLTTVIICAAIFLLSGCDNRVIPLKSTYQKDPYQFSVSASKDLVWNKLIDFFTTKGLAIKTLDKADGLITTDNTSFLNNYTWENKDGSLMNPDATVVCSKFRGPFTLVTSFTPTAITGQWIVRMREEGDKTSLLIKLANAAGKIATVETGVYAYENRPAAYNLQIESTGVFEKSVEDALR